MPSRFAHVPPLTSTYLSTSNSTPIPVFEVSREEFIAGGGTDQDFDRQMGDFAIQMTSEFIEFHIGVTWNVLESTRPLALIKPLPLPLALALLYLGRVCVSSCIVASFTS